MLQLLDWILATKVRRAGEANQQLSLYFALAAAAAVLNGELELLGKYCTINHTSLELTAKALPSFVPRETKHRGSSNVNFIVLLRFLDLALLT